MYVLVENERVCLRSAVPWSEFLSVLEGDEAVDLTAAPVSAAAARRIQEFYDHHQVCPLPPLPAAPTTRLETAPEWYVAFISSLAHADLQDLLLAADFLGLQAVLDVGCCYIAGLPRGHRFLKK